VIKYVSFALPAEATMIMPDSAAGEYLAKMGLPEEDFNSYATHRGDHLTAQRATFANPTLKNEMVVVDGKVKPGSLARIEPEGRITRMWEAIETYMVRKQPLIIIAGADYGQGSSRDWAAKGVRLAGVEAIAAEGFERIHRTNLVGMGVLPLEFKPGVNRKTLGLDGTETYDVVGARKPRTELTLVIHRRSGARVEVPYCVLCHNAKTIDPASGLNVDMVVMTHKIHMGARLPSVIAGSGVGVFAVKSPVEDAYCTDQPVRSCGGPEL
jgi:aconitase A